MRLRYVDVETKKITEVTKMEYGNITIFLGVQIANGLCLRSLKKQV